MKRLVSSFTHQMLMKYKYKTWVTLAKGVGVAIVMAMGTAIMMAVFSQLDEPDKVGRKNLSLQESDVF